MELCIEAVLRVRSSVAADSLRSDDCLADAVGASLCGEKAVPGGVDAEPASRNGAIDVGTVEVLRMFTA
jgi:hypothetical protein